MRNFDLSPLYRSAIGFDRLFNTMESGQQNGGYPPYNVELVSEDHYRISIAVSGFVESELEIMISNNILIIRGARHEHTPPRNYLYQGIAERNFERKFQLAEHIQIEHASLKNGLLHIEMKRVIPESMKVKKIPIE